MVAGFPLSKAGSAALILVLALWGLQQPLERIYKVWETERNFFDSSKKVLAKYENVRRRGQYQNLKLATNSYQENVLTLNNLYSPADEPTHKRENATLLMLVRNFELPEALKSMRSLEDRFNWKYQYDWTFLNEVEFTFEFKEAVRAMASGNVHFGLIPEKDWFTPDWINETRYAAALDKMEEDGVLYGGSRSYRNMCRFNSGYFFRQKELANYDYYFRVEPGVDYFCDFPYDPFKVMRTQKKKYGFVISIHEYQNTIESLWDSVENYVDQFGNNTLDMANNAYNFLTDKSIIGLYQPIYSTDSTYNLCHFWSNFEIGDLNFFRSKEYIEFFDFLDQTGGFYYERWGDAPVHSIGVSLLLNRDEIIHFDELAYTHVPFMTCPTSYHLRVAQRCQCDYEDESNIDVTPNSCLMRWWKNGSGKKFLKEI